jgi:hypothetical protein
MSFLGEPFKHDLFVSYSHGAFKGQHDSDLKLWSQKFANGLRSELAGSGEFDEISVFLDEVDRSDENVDRTAELTGLLRERVRGSALFTLLMTPQYLKSKWCLQELDWWCKKHHPDTLGAGGRMFPCRVRPTEQTTWPEVIKDVVGYFCYDRNKPPDKARPFTYMGAPGDLDDYKDLLVDVAGDMMQRLRAIRSVLDERRRQEEHARRLIEANPEGGQVVFLHARPRAAATWEAACERLLGEKFSVFPDRPIPMAADGGLDPEYQTQITKSDAVLLLGTEDGPAIDTDIIVIGRNFRNLAAATKAFLPCAILNMVGDPLKTDRRVRNASNLGMGWIDSTINDWPIRVRSWLVETSAQMDLVT